MSNDAQRQPNHTSATRLGGRGAERERRNLHPLWAIGVGCKAALVVIIAIASTGLHAIPLPRGDTSSDSSELDG